MVEYMHSKGIPRNTIRKTINWLHKQDYDTDAIKLDVDIDTVQNQQSYLLFHMKHEPVIKRMSEFIDKTKGKHSFSGHDRILDFLMLSFF